MLFSAGAPCPTVCAIDGPLRVMTPPAKAGSPLPSTLMDPPALAQVVLAPAPRGRLSAGRGDSRGNRSVLGIAGLDVALVLAGPAAHVDGRDARVPVAERDAGAAAAPESGEVWRCRVILLVGARLAGKFVGQPDRVAARNRGAVVTPTWTGDATAGERVVLGEAIVRSKTFGGDVNIRRRDPRVQRHVRRGRKVVVADQREAEQCPPGVRDRDAAVDRVVVGHDHAALSLEPRAQTTVAHYFRADHVVLHRGLLLAAEGDPGIQGAPQAAVGEHRAQHTAVTAVERTRTLDFVVYRLAEEEDLPAPGPEDSGGGGVVDAILQRRIARFLVRWCWDGVSIDPDRRGA